MKQLWYFQKRRVAIFRNFFFRPQLESFDSFDFSVHKVGEILDFTSFDINYLEADDQKIPLLKYSLLPQ